MKRLMAAFILFVSFLDAGSVRLINDSPFKLRAVIRGNDGTYLGEMILNPAHEGNWSDSYGQIGHFGKGSLYKEGATRSQTPYTVIWHCLDGADYSICTIISTGGLVNAQGCDGARICNTTFPQKPCTPPCPYPNQPKGFLDRQNDLEPIR